MLNPKISVIVNMLCIFFCHQSSTLYSPAHKKFMMASVPPEQTPEKTFFVQELETKDIYSVILTP